MLQGSFVNSPTAGNFTLPGVYIYNAPQSQVNAVGPAINQVGIVGTGQYSTPNVPLQGRTLSDAYGYFGTNTTLPNSIVRDVASMIPEANSFVFVRVTDGTDHAAMITVLDGAAGTIGTYAYNSTGSLPNGGVDGQGRTITPATLTMTLVQGSLAAGGTGAPPVILISISFPNGSPENFRVVAGTASAGYVAATFKANAAAAINVGSAQQPASARGLWTSGSSTATPNNLGTGFVATGGLDGATTITTSVLTGSDTPGARTGLYALRGQINGGQYVFAGCYDTTLVQTMATFNAQEGVRSGVSFPLGATTPAMVTLKSTNNAQDPTVDVVADWLIMIDPYTGNQVYVAPAAKAEAVISTLDYYQPPLNKPEGAGAKGFLGTYTGPVTGGDPATRYAAGINYFSNANGVWQLASGKASDGKTNISDVRAAWFFGISFMGILSPYLGQTQTTAVNDATRQAVRGTINDFMSQQLQPVQKIQGYSNVCDLSNNPSNTEAQGYLIDNIAIQTLDNISVIVMNQQVGVNVALPT